MNKLYFLPFCLFLYHPRQPAAAKNKPAGPQEKPPANPEPPRTYHLIWSDEFNDDGPPNPANWTFEHGFVRNQEQQWYQPENAYCEHGLLTIEAKKEHKPNPNYQPGSRRWQENRPTIDYTSACLETRGLHSWKTGRFEMRGRIDIDPGCWPAWWTLGIDKPWPANGEIDIMEYYRGKLLANIACLGAGQKTRWFSKTQPVDKKWAAKFHTWRMDWDQDSIHLCVDDTPLNSTPLSALVNQDGSAFQPFAQPHFMLLNLAIGGANGGDPGQTGFPRKFQVDYVRVYQLN